MEEPLLGGGPFGERARLDQQLPAWHVTDGVVHGSLQRPGLRECRADRAHGALACRDRVIAGRLALPDELHIAFADGVQGVKGVYGHSFLCPPQERKARDRCAVCAARRGELDDLNLHRNPANTRRRPGPATRRAPALEP